LSGEHPVLEVIAVRESERIGVRVLGELDRAGAPILSERPGGGDRVSNRRRSRSTYLTGRGAAGVRASLAIAGRWFGPERLAGGNRPRGRVGPWGSGPGTCTGASEPAGRDASDTNHTRP